MRSSPLGIARPPHAPRHFALDDLEYCWTQRAQARRASAQNFVQSVNMRAKNRKVKRFGTTNGHARAQRSTDATNVNGCKKRSSTCVSTQGDGTYDDWRQVDSEFTNVADSDGPRVERSVGGATWRDEHTGVVQRAPDIAKAETS